MVRILLVDDQERVRQGLRMRLALEPDLCIVGEACNGLEALRLAQMLRPDVVVLDMEMPEMDGISAAQNLCELAPCCATVILSMYGDATLRQEAVAAGAAACVAKQGQIEELLAILREAALRQKSEAHPSNSCGCNPSQDR